MSPQLKTHMVLRHRAGNALPPGIIPRCAECLNQQGKRICHPARPPTAGRTRGRVGNGRRPIPPLAWPKNWFTPSETCRENAKHEGYVHSRVEQD